ncbi:MAG: Hpt domain-containing protein [Methylocystis sp.]|uniref:Hpt domain-containing protein n=1 Tax=Methylocystis sp. TaxID=1911079 RepID=UPI003DA3C28F
MSEDLDEIWALYADDGAQSLDTVEAALLKLRRDACDRDAIAELFRAMHTFKGNSRLIGLVAIESCAHIAEDLVGLVRDEGVELDAEMLELLLEASDRLREMMELAVSTRRDADEAVSADITYRMKDKYARLREADAGATGRPDDAGATPLPRAQPTAAPADKGDSFETAVVFAGAGENLSTDPHVSQDIPRNCKRVHRDDFRGGEGAAARG